MKPRRKNWEFRWTMTLPAISLPANPVRLFTHETAFLIDEREVFTASHFSKKKIDSAVVF
jgi:hypothetical protein